jgi:hypothetical protein
MNEADKIKAQKDKELRNSQELTVAIKKLSEQFIKAGETVKKQTNAPMSAGGSLKEGLKNHYAPVMAATKQLSSPAGMLDMLSAKTGGGLLSTVLGTASSALKERAEQRQKKTQWAADFLTGTDRGRELIQKHGLDKASSIAGKYYDTKTKLESEINEQEERRNSLKKSGIKGADLASDELDALAKKKRQLSYVMGERQSIAKKKEAGPRKETIRKEEPLIDALFKSQEAAIREQYPEESKNREFMAEVKNSMQEELLELSEEQLAQLKILVKNSVASEEDKYEEQKNQKIEKDGEKVLPKKEAKGGLMDTLMDKIPGMDMLKKAGPALMRMLPFAGQALGVGAAGYAGYKAGGLLNDYVLNPAAEAITGTKGATVGTALYDGVDKLKGMFGMETDAQKIKRADDEALVNNGKKKLAEGKPVSESVATAMRAAGISVPASSVIVPGKTPVPSAAKSTQDMAVKEEVLDQAKKEAAIPGTVAQKGSTNINTVNTSSTTVMNARPDIRSPEPTFNRLLGRNFR